MSSSGRSRNNVDTRLIRFPPRTTVRGGNDIAILHHLYLPAPPVLSCLHLSVLGTPPEGVPAIRRPQADKRDKRTYGVTQAQVRLRKCRLFSLGMTFSYCAVRWRIPDFPCVVDIAGQKCIVLVELSIV